MSKSLGWEQETLEFKDSTAELKEAVVSICAMLNKHQNGELYFGVDHHGTPIGQTVTDDILMKVRQEICENISPSISPVVQNIVIDGYDCIHVEFEGYETPYSAYGIPRIRLGWDDFPMTGASLESYLRDYCHEDSWEKGASFCTAEDVDEKKLRDFIKKASADVRIDFEYTDKISALKQLGLMNGDRLSNAGKTLFVDKAPNILLQMAIFAGTEKLTFLDYKYEEGSAMDMMELAERYILSNIRWRAEIQGICRVEIPEIPREAIHEAVRNMFAHTDYKSGQNNKVMIFRDRVEILSYGKFPDRYTPEDFIRKDIPPVQRNPLIASLLTGTKRNGSIASGFRRIAEACDKAGCRYEFQMHSFAFVTVFYRQLI